MYKPFVFDLPTSDNSFLDKSNTTNNIIITRNISQPLFSLGFHSFLHRTKGSMSITKKLETKNKFYYVVNPFEHIINDYQNDIANKTKEYFNITDDPNILSRAFYKMWEILYLFNIADTDNLTYAALAEGPGSFLQAVIKYREKFGYNIKNDKMFSITIHPERGNYIHMGKKFLNYYKKTYPTLIKPHKTFTKKTADKYKSRDNGDITQLKTIELFKKDIGKKFADLITADGGFKWNDENYQEQEAYMLILGEIITALHTQAKGGAFILKIFECFTNTTLKMIYILTSFYENSYIYKPFFSRGSNSERYVVCKNFKYDQNKDSKLLDQKLKILEQILEKMKTNLFVNDIFIEFELPSDFVDKIKYINIQIANTQQIMINKIIKYIKGNNYFGDLYHEYRDKQIDANKWWLNTFFPNKITPRKAMDKSLKDQISYNISEMKLFNKSFL